jgi:Zn-finger nucleic acid-binding protein
MIEECPRCSSADFDKVELMSVQLDRCRGCRGIWFGDDEFEKVIEQTHGPGARGAVEQLDPAGRPDAEAYLPLRVSCPGCGEALLAETPVRFEFIRHFVMADRCPACGSVWLDASELSLLARYIRSEDAAIARAAAESEGLGETASDAPRPVSRRRFWRGLIGLDA